MPRPKIDFSDLLNEVELEEFLQLGDEKPKAVPQLESEKLSPPEAFIIHWREDTCCCGKVYESQEHAPTVRYTLHRRVGFGYHEAGKVYIPATPGFDSSDLPQEVRVTKGRIQACPHCTGRRPSLSLFPDSEVAFLISKDGTALPPNAARWLEMHKTARRQQLDETIKDMDKRAKRRGQNIDFDALLVFRTTESDLQAQVAGQVLCDPERQIEL